MKKIASLFLVAATLLLLSHSSRASWAVSMPCQLVPHAVFTAALTTTVVGLHASPDVLANAKVFWAFFDGSGAQRSSGNFALGPSTFSGFVWSSAAGPALQGVNGFLLFCLDNDNNNRVSEPPDEGTFLGASAFFVDTSSSDVAYLPVLSLFGVAQSDPNQWSTLFSEANPVATAPISLFPSVAESRVTMQYAINGMVNNGNDTTIYIWSDANTLGPSQNMTMFTDTGTNAAITVLTPSAYLNVIDLETVTGIDSSFTGGFINWIIPAAFTSYVFVFTVIKSPAFGAVQTLVSMVSSP